jgi:hypothetical protein
MAKRVGMRCPQRKFARLRSPEITAYQTIRVVLLPAYDLVGNELRAMRRPGQSVADASQQEENCPAARQSHFLAVNSTADSGFLFKNEKIPRPGISIEKSRKLHSRLESNPSPRRKCETRGFLFRRSVRDGFQTFWRVRTADCFSLQRRGGNAERRCFFGQVGARLPARFRAR